MLVYSFIWKGFAACRMNFGLIKIPRDQIRVHIVIRTKYLVLKF